MNEKSFLILSLFISIFGIIILFFLSDVEITPTTIKKINSEETGNTVYINGIVRSVEKRGEVTIIKLTEQNTIEVVAFQDIELDESTQLYVEGRVDEYKGSKQIIADKIEIR